MLAEVPRHPAVVDGGEEVDEQEIAVSLVGKDGTERRGQRGCEEKGAGDSAGECEMEEEEEEEEMPVIRGRVEFHDS
jgi:hypothetical protein